MERICKYSKRTLKGGRLWCSEPHQSGGCFSLIDAVKYDGAIRHDILDFCERDLVTLGEAPTSVSIAPI